MARERSKFSKEQIEGLLASVIFQDVYNGVVAIHEDYKDDQKFWGEVFFTFFANKDLNRKYIPFYPLATNYVSNTTENSNHEDCDTGSDFVKDNFLSFAGLTYQESTKYRSVNLRLIICVDADSKYLYQPKVWYLNQPYIFHTHAYSIENYNSIGKFLNKEFAKYSLGAIHTIDFEQLFKDFSTALSSLFCYWLYAFENDYKDLQPLVGKKVQKEVMEMELFCKNMQNDNKNLQTDLVNFQENIIAEITKRAKDVIVNIEITQGFGQLLDETEKQKKIAQLKSSHNIDENDLFLYFKGHWVFEEFLLPIVNYQFWYLKEKALQNAKTKTDKEQEIAKKQINNQFGETVLETTTKIKTIVEQIYKDSIHSKISPIDKIYQDLESTSW